MARLHPPTQLLRAFVATARQLNTARAAMELHLSQSAVSKQILELEALLGTTLFDRVRGRLLLSAEGQRYLPRISQALDLMEAATLDAMAHSARSGVLNLATSPTFGAKWLIPRLPRFQQAHPEVTVNFVPYAKGHDFSVPELDCAIRFGEGLWPGAVADYLIGRELVVVAAPGLIRSGKLRRHEDVLKQTLLHHVQVPTAWEQWFSAKAIQHPNPMAGPKLDQVTSIGRAAMAGLGIGLVPLCLVQDDLENGLLGAAFGETTLPRAGYYLCHPEGRAKLPALVAFKAWLAKEIRRTPTRLDQLALPMRKR